MISIVTTTTLIMNSPMQCKNNKLILSLKDKTHWNLAYIKFLVTFISALYKVKTVNFLKLAKALGGHTQVEEYFLRPVETDPLQ
jgi:hypothetical protein